MAIHKDRQRLVYKGLPLSRKQLGHKFTSESVTDALGFETLETRLARLSISGLRTLISKDAAHLYDAPTDAFEEVNSLMPPPMPRHFVPDLADTSEYFREYKARRREIYAKHKRDLSHFLELPPEEQASAMKDAANKRKSSRARARDDSPPTGGPGSGADSPQPPQAES